MKLVNIADEGAKYKAPAGNGKPGSRWKDGDACNG